MGRLATGLRAAVALLQILGSAPMQLADVGMTNSNDQRTTGRSLLITRGGLDWDVGGWRREHARRM